MKLEQSFSAWRNGTISNGELSILKPDELPEELLAALGGPLSFYQSLKARNELREPDDL